MSNGLSEGTESYSDLVNPNDFVINDDDVNYFTNAWDTARLMESTRTEDRELTATATADIKALKKDNPEMEEAIDKYGVFDPDIEAGGTNQAGGGISAIKARLERDRFKRYFNTGKIYMDENGFIKSNDESLSSTVNEEQESLKQYWKYRQLSDGTNYDSETLRNRTVARVQNEIIRLRKEGSGASGLVETGASMLGTMAFVATEPEIAVTMLGSTGNVGRGIIGNSVQAFGKEFGLSLMADVMTQPKIMEWRRQLYDPARGIEAYSTLDAIQNSLVNAGFAGVIQGTGSLVVDGSTMFRYRGQVTAGKSKFSVIDKYKGKRETSKGTKRELMRETISDTRSSEWKAKRTTEVDEALARSSENGQKVGDEIVEEVVDLMASSPTGNLARHVDNISKAQEHIENGTKFPSNNIHAELDVATVDDFIAVKQPNGETVLARVIDSDATDVAIVGAEGETIILNRASNTADTDGWAVSKNANPVDMGGKADAVNEINIRDIIDRDNVEHELIQAHSDNEDIIRYNKGEEDTIQQLVDMGCLNINDMKVG